MDKKYKILIAASTAAFLISSFFYVKPYFDEQQPVIVGTIYPEVDPEALPEEKADLNTADIQTIAACGVGYGTAEKIVRLREELGGFENFKDLRKIIEINEQAEALLRAYFCISGPEETQTAAGTAVTEEPELTAETTASEFEDVWETEVTSDTADTTALEETAPPETTPPETTSSETSAETEAVTEAAPEPLYIDLNTASSEELQALKGIGPKTADKIIAYRTEKGGFSSVEEIMNVSGIGDKKFAAIKDRIYVTADESNLTERSDESASQLININTATKEELMTLNGIGDVISGRIIAYREANGGFKTVEELMNVKGIGEKTFEKLKDFITV